MSNRLIYVVCQLAIFAVFATPQCILPFNKEPINWNMLPGRWFNNQESSGPLNKVVGCHILANFRGIPGDGVYFELRDVKSFTSTKRPFYSSIPLHFVPYRNGTHFVVLDRNYEFLWTDEVEEFIGVENVRAGASELDSLFHTALGFYTDYKNYLITLLCLGESKFIWVRSRQPEMTQATFLAAQAFLAGLEDGWDEVPLYTTFSCPSDMYNPVLN